jgi:hypothetical protein
MPDSRQTIDVDYSKLGRQLNDKLSGGCFQI